MPTQSPPAYYDTYYLEGAISCADYASGELARDAAGNFRGTKWDYYDKLSMITEVSPKARVLDFGGGAGIIARQIREAGHHVVVFEVARELRKISVGMLGLETYSDLDELLRTGESFDVILLHHVLEHIEDLPSCFSALERLLRPNGVLWIFVPNAAADQWEGDPASVLGAAHVCAFEPSFFQQNMQRFGFDCVTFSTPFAFHDRGAAGERTRLGRGHELAVVAWRGGDAPPSRFAQWPFQLPDLRHSTRAQSGC